MQVRLLRFLMLLAASAGGQPAARKPLVVLSIDGLDNRYLEQADSYGLKIPHLRRLMREGQFARGVVGVYPTVTWPSHTTIITGVDPVVHGILGNRRPQSEGGEYYWSAKLLRVPTLLDAAKTAGLKTAAITWPVTIDAPVDFNLPEYFVRRRGGDMDMRSIEAKSQSADLVGRIKRVFPSFGEQWMDDRNRTLAARYLLREVKPDLLLIHLVGLDSEEHDNGPFTPEAFSTLEYTDELIGRIAAELPKNGVLALVSDHGFEKVGTEVNLRALRSTGVRGYGGVVAATDAEGLAFLRETARDPRYGIGREIPDAERRQFPAASFSGALALFEPKPGFWFSGGSGGAGESEVFHKPREIGNHGHWPTRYRAVFVLWGSGVNAGRTPEFSMKELASRLGRVIGVTFK